MKAKELPTKNKKAKELPTKIETKRQASETDLETAPGAEANAKTETLLEAAPQAENLNQEAELDAELIAEIEEERKKRKNKEASFYFLAAQDDKLKAARDAAAFEKSFKAQSILLDILTQDERKKIPQIVAGCAAIVERADIVKSLRHEFFSIKNHPQAEEIRRDLKKINLEEKDFSAIALCAAEDKMEKVQKHLANEYKKSKKIKVSQEVFNENELNDVKSSSVEKAHKAIVDAAHGDPKKLARLLKAGLENCCRRFADKKITTAKAMEWSENAAEILFVLNRTPEVRKTCGLTESQIECAKLTANLGIEIRSGMQAIEMLTQVQQGAELPKYQLEDLKEKVFKMHRMTYDRSKFIKMWDEPKMEIPQIHNPMR